MPHNHNLKDDKAKDFFGSLKKLTLHCKPFLLSIILIALFSFIGSLLSVIAPDLARQMADIITEGLRNSSVAAQIGHPDPGIDMNAIRNIGIILILFCAGILIFGIAENFMAAHFNNRFSQKLRREVSDKINSVPLSYFNRNSIGDTLSRMTNDVDTISQTLNQGIGSLVWAIATFIGAIIMMFITSWQLATIAITASLVGFSLMIIILRRSQKYFYQFQTQLGTMNGHVEESFTGMNIIKTYNAEAEVNQEFNSINQKLYTSGKKSQFYSGLMRPIMGFIGNFGYVAVCVAGAVFTTHNIITFGVIIAFMIYVRRFTQPLEEFAQIFTSFQSTAAASERVFEFLETPDMTKENVKQTLDKNIVKGSVVFDHVRFAYDDKPNEPVIKDFSAQIEAGQKVAIVGPTGAGKTTLVYLLMKFYDIDSGDIKIDGVSTKDITRENVHELFTMVLQDTWTFEGSIKENIRYDKTDVSDQEIIKVCKAVELDHFIRTLDHGYNTILTNDSSLSVGQKQLLTIARAMIEDKPLLILDEATSSVDTRTEIIVQEAMDKLAKGRTSFIIAHLLSTIKNADIILVMEHGDIVEQGTHNSLLKKNGIYARLYNSQFETN